MASVNTSMPMPMTSSALSTITNRRSARSVCTVIKTLILRNVKKMMVFCSVRRWKIISVANALIVTIFIKIRLVILFVFSIKMTVVNLNGIATKIYLVIVVGRDFRIKQVVNLFLVEIVWNMLVWILQIVASVKIITFLIWICQVIKLNVCSLLMQRYQRVVLILLPLTFIPRESAQSVDLDILWPITMIRLRLHVNHGLTLPIVRSITGTRLSVCNVNQGTVWSQMELAQRSLSNSVVTLPRGLIIARNVIQDFC